MLNADFVVQFNAKFPNLGNFCLRMGKIFSIGNGAMFGHNF